MRPVARHWSAVKEERRMVVQEMPVVLSVSSALLGATEIREKKSFV